MEILQVCDRDSLILFDELCAGTDPAEGAALAIALIEFCRKCGAKVATTTHYAELKLYAMRTAGVINASCEFNVETLSQPTCSSASPASPTLCHLAAAWVSTRKIIETRTAWSARMT